MGYPSTILIAALLSSAALMAQISLHGTAALFTVGPVSESCPVDFFVSRISAPAVMVAKEGKSSHSGPGLKMNLAGSDASEVVRATVIVYGSSKQTRLAPATINPDADMTETFELRSDAGAQSLLHSAVWLKKMSAVSWVDLTKIEYADGSVWHASSISQCRAAPSMFVLVDAVAARKKLKQQKR